jgi:hypothetical protein
MRDCEGLLRPRALRKFRQDSDSWQASLARSTRTRPRYIRIRPRNENGIFDEDDSEEDEEGIFYVTYAVDCLIPRDINSTMSDSTNEDSDVMKLRSPTARELSRSPTARLK